MAAYLSAVPAPGRAGTAAPTTSERDRGMDELTETTKWPWHLTNTDVITIDPKTGATGAWPVIGEPTYNHDRIVVFCDTGDGGEGVFTYDGTQQATVRAQTTYTAPPLLTPEQREQALQGLTGEDCCFIAGALMQGCPEIFDRQVSLLRIRQARADEKRPA